MAKKSTEPKVSRKEDARRKRRAAYVRAKELRAKDPRHLALKAAAKLRRREVYRQTKEKRKVRIQEEKARARERQAEKRATTDVELMKLVKPGAPPTNSAPGASHDP